METLYITNFNIYMYVDICDCVPFPYIYIHELSDYYSNFSADLWSRTCLIHAQFRAIAMKYEVVQFAKKRHSELLRSFLREFE